jgi:hypothetical protein
MLSNRFFHSDKNRIKANNFNKFKSWQEAYDYLFEDVFTKEHFEKHVALSAEKNKVSYIIAYEVITNHLTDILYEIDKNISYPRKKVMIRVLSYFSLRIGFMISQNKVKKEFNDRMSKYRKNEYKFK